MSVFFSFIVHWKGGVHTQFEMPRALVPRGRKTAADDVEVIRKMAARYGDDDIARVLNKLGRRTGHLELRVQRSGHCPFHKSANEKSRCFSVNLEKNVFQCKNPKCAAHGNALDLWVKHSGLPLYEAALDLADTFGLEIRREQKTRGNP